MREERVRKAGGVGPPAEARRRTTTARQKRAIVTFVKTSRFFIKPSAYNIRIIMSSRAKQKQNTITEEQNQKVTPRFARIHLLFILFSTHSSQPIQILHIPRPLPPVPHRRRVHQPHLRCIGLFQCEILYSGALPRPHRGKHTQKRTCKALAPCTTPRIARAAARHRRPLVE